MATQQVVYKNFDLFCNCLRTFSANGRALQIVHFNDVYNIEEQLGVEPAGGAARFIALIEQFMSENPSTLVFFSGDAISPSLLSNLFEGKQMIEILNKCHISAACVGNHEFDLGIDVIESHIAASNFPWLLSNVCDMETNKPLGNAKVSHVIEIGKIRIGVIGLVEEEWISTLWTVDCDEIIYEPFVEVGQKLAVQLKTEQKCNFVIALTHMRWSNDESLAQKVPEIDLFLGGHDHDYVVKKINNRLVVKSGSDFKEFSLIELYVEPDSGTLTVDKIERIEVNSVISPNPEIESIVNGYIDKVNMELDKVLGLMKVELEGRFSYVRTQETNLGNFITDIMLEAVNADCAIFNSGGLRSDTLHPIGEFKVRDLRKILPFFNTNVVLSVTGSTLLKALENAVSKYPQHEGRFLQVSGLKFAFDPTKPAGERIDPRLVLVQQESLNFYKEYSVMLNTYLQKGKDGFECFVDCPILIEEENLPITFTLVENHFKTIQSLTENRNLMKRHMSLVPQFVVNNLINSIHEQGLEKEASSDQEGLKNKRQKFKSTAYMISKLMWVKKKTLSKSQRIQIKQSVDYLDKMREYEQKAMELSPQCENRIICIRSKEEYEQLLEQFSTNS